MSLPERTTVRCINCSTGLRSLGGMVYPVHLIAVKVLKADLLHWQEQGYEFSVE